MGYASYFEDIREKVGKLSEEFEKLEKDTRKANSPDVEQHFRAIIKVQKELHKDMEYVTDPQMDILTELGHAQSENIGLKSRLDKERHRLSNLGRQFKKLEEQNKDLNNRIKELEEERSRLSNRIKELEEQNNEKKVWMEYICLQEKKGKKFRKIP